MADFAGALTARSVTLAARPSSRESPRRRSPKSKTVTFRGSAAAKSHSASHDGERDGAAIARLRKHFQSLDKRLEGSVPVDLFRKAVSRHTTALTRQQRREVMAEIETSPPGRTLSWPAFVEKLDEHQGSLARSWLADKRAAAEDSTLVKTLRYTSEADVQQVVLPAFVAVDADRTGSVTLEQAEVALAEAGLVFSERQLEALWQQFATNTGLPYSAMLQRLGHTMAGGLRSIGAKKAEGANGALHAATRRLSQTERQPLAASFTTANLSIDELLIRLEDKVGENFTSVRAACLSEDAAETGTISVSAFKQIVEHFLFHLTGPQFRLLRKALGISAAGVDYVAVLNQLKPEGLNTPSAIEASSGYRFREATFNLQGKQWPYVHQAFDRKVKHSGAALRRHFEQADPRGSGTVPMGTCRELVAAWFAPLSDDHFRLLVHGLVEQDQVTYGPLLDGAPREQDAPTPDPEAQRPNGQPPADPAQAAAEAARAIARHCRRSPIKFKADFARLSRSDGTLDLNGLRLLLAEYGISASQPKLEQLALLLQFRPTFHASSPAVHHNKLTSGYLELLRALGCQPPDETAINTFMAPQQATGAEPEWQVAETLIEQQLDGSHVARVLKKAINPRSADGIARLDSAHNVDLQLVEVETTDTTDTTDTTGGVGLTGSQLFVLGSSHPADDGDPNPNRVEYQYTAPQAQEAALPGSGPHHGTTTQFPIHQQLATLRRRDDDTPIADAVHDALLDLALDGYQLLKREFFRHDHDLDGILQVGEITAMLRGLGFDVDRDDTARVLRKNFKLIPEGLSHGKPGLSLANFFSGLELEEEIDHRIALGEHVIFNPDRRRVEEHETLGSTLEPPETPNAHRRHGKGMTLTATTRWTNHDAPAAAASNGLASTTRRETMTRTQRTWRGTEEPVEEHTVTTEETVGRSSAAEHFGVGGDEEGELEVTGGPAPEADAPVEEEVRFPEENGLDCDDGDQGLTTTSEEGLSVAGTRLSQTMQPNGNTGEYSSPTRHSVTGLILGLPPRSELDLLRANTIRVKTKATPAKPLTSITDAMLAVRTHLQDIRQAFYVLDTVHSGVVLAKSLRSVLQEYVGPMTDGVFSALVEGVRRDVKQRVYYDSFIRSVKSRAHKLSEETGHSTWATTRSLDWKLLHNHGSQKSVPNIHVAPHEHTGKEAEAAVLQLVADKYEALYRDFRECDFHRTGRVTNADVRRVLEKHGGPLTGVGFAKVLHRVNATRDPEVDYRLFLMRYGGHHPQDYEYTTGRPLPSPANPHRSKGTPRKRPTGKAKPKPKHHRGTELVLQRIRPLVQHDAQRLKAEFARLDRLQTGRVSRRQFRAVLQQHVHGLELEESELELISSRWFMPSDPGKRQGVEYTAFLRFFVMGLHAGEANTRTLRKRGTVAKSTSLAGMSLGTDAVLSSLKPRLVGHWKELRRGFKAKESRQHKGTVTPVEFRDVLRRCHVAVSNDEFFHVVAFLDPKLTGRVRFDHFLQLVLQQS